MRGRGNRCWQAFGVLGNLVGAVVDRGSVGIAGSELVDTVQHPARLGPGLRRDNAGEARAEFLADAPVDVAVAGMRG